MPDNDKKRRRWKFTDESKRDAAAWVLDTDRSIAQVARELDVHESSLGRWAAGPLGRRVAQQRADRDPVTIQRHSRVQPSPSG